MSKLTIKKSSEKKEKIPLQIIKEKIILVFSKTNQKYLYANDLKFLLLKNGGELKRIRDKRKNLWELWNTRFELDKEPFRSLTFSRQRLYRILNDMVKSGELKKVTDRKDPMHGSYYLPKDNEKIKFDPVALKHKEILESIDTSLIHTCPFNQVTFYGISQSVFTLPPDVRDKLEKLAKKFESLADEFLDLVYKNSVFQLEKILNEIEKGDFSEKQKKLAYKYLYQFLTYKIDWERLLESGVYDASNFKWFSDGEDLVVFPKKHLLDSRLTKLIKSFQQKRDFYHSKLIVIEPKAKDYHYRKFTTLLTPLLERIRKKLS